MTASVAVTCAVVAGCALGAAGAVGAGLLGGGGCSIDREPVVVDLRPGHAPVADHALDAVAAGHPLVLHVARDEASENRRASLRGHPTRPGHDRDEYPPAVSDEGGRGASVRHVRSSVNRSAGALMGRALRGSCDGQPFVVRP